MLQCTLPSTTIKGKKEKKHGKKENWKRLLKVTLPPSSYVSAYRSLNSDRLLQV
jgi:hypothetical protein